MHILYDPTIPKEPVATYSLTALPIVALAAVQSVEDDVNWLERGLEAAITNAIQATIVHPFQAWCLHVWQTFVEVSPIICCATSLLALMFAMIGVKKCRPWVIIPIVVYLFIRTADYCLRGGVW